MAFRLRVGAVLLGAGLAVGAGVAQDTSTAPSFSYTLFDVPGAVTIKTPGLSNGGNAVGYYTDAGGALRGFERLRNGTVISPIIDPNDNQNFTACLGINKAGTIVGEYLNLNNGVYTYHGFFDVGGVFTTSDYPGPYSTAIQDINDNGDFVGIYGSSVFPTTGFVNFGGALASVAYPGATATRLQGVNNRREVVGGWVDGSGTTHGLIRSSAGALSTFDYPGSTYTLASGATDNGIIAGTYHDAAGHDHAFLRTPGGALMNIDDPGAMDTALGNINDFNWVAGHIVDAGGTWHGLIVKPARP